MAGKMIQDLGGKKKGGTDQEDVRNIYQRPRRNKEKMEMNSKINEVKKYTIGNQ